MADTVQLVTQLADRDSVKREAAAREFYRLGRELGDGAVARWRADPQLATLLASQPAVGVAVRPENFEEIRKANGSPRLAVVPPDQDAKEFELNFSGGVRLDILTTGTPGGGGAMARFLEKHGEGIQQVEYATSDVNQATECIRARLGLEPVYPASRPGADGTRVNFFLTSTAEGKKVLIELVEPPPKT